MIHKHTGRWQIMAENVFGVGHNARVHGELMNSVSSV